MIRSARAVVEAPAVLREVRSGPPLTIRQVISEQDEVCALCLVGSAAGPLPGDDVTLELVIAPHASASLVAAGAMIAQGRDGGIARLTIEVQVGAGGRLDADPGTLIVCAGAQVEVGLSIVLADTATLRWRERLVLGRSGEGPGAAVLDWNVRRGDQPLLRQRITLSDPRLTRWPGMLGEHRLLETELRVGPALDAETVVHSPAHVTQKLAANATLMTALG